MRPRKDEETLVDVLDVLLRDGAVLRADVIVSVAGIPLIGLKLTAAIAGMETMTEYGFFEEWDVERRQTAVTRRQHKKKGQQAPDERERLTLGSTPESDRSHERESDDKPSRKRKEEQSRARNDERSRTDTDEESDEDTAEGSRPDDE